LSQAPEKTQADMDHTCKQSGEREELQESEVVPTRLSLKKKPSPQSGEEGRVRPLDSGDKYEGCAEENR
jgi:hypothetical protein